MIDYDLLRKEVIVGYLQRQKDSFIEICNLYEAKKDELKEIIQKASNYTERWNRIIKLFNSRFFVPFKAKVSNLPDVLLHEEAATLTFEYQDDEGEELILLEEKKSQEVLSQGELRAYNIMQNLFVIEGLKDDGQEHLLIMDDIADSFDYKNKYAILEYMHDIMEVGKFKLIVLTHNFDFNRTAVSRLKADTYFAYRKPGRVINLMKGLFRQDLLKARIITQAHKNNAAFVSMIPFVRNLVEYSQGTRSNDYKLLTACLHDKPNTGSLKKGELYDCMKPHLFDLIDIEVEDRDRLYLDILNEATIEALGDPNEINLPNKIVLSISIRLKTDAYLKSILTEEQRDQAKQNENQTGEYCKLFKKYYGETRTSEWLTVNKVLMLTSENIHLNNFMFEPIVDMPITHLISLYNEVDNLGKA